MDYAVTHHTLYRYSSSVAQCHNEARLTPRDTPWQRCPISRVQINPPPAMTAERLDFFGNRVTYFAIQDIHQALEVTAVSEVSVDPRPVPELESTPPWEAVAGSLGRGPDEETIEARQFALESPYVNCCAEALRDYARDSFAAGRPLLAAAWDLTRRIYRDFTYDPKFTTLATPLQEVLDNRRGVCQDYAHLAIGCLRALGLAARYMSGYLENLPAPGRPRLTGADASHAWLAVYCPGHGWIEFDPTNNCLPGVQHITLAWGRDYGDVAPLKGVMVGGGSHTLDVAVKVRRRVARGV